MSVWLALISISCSISGGSLSQAVRKAVTRGRKHVAGMHCKADHSN